jgi:hypothetical protein
MQKILVALALASLSTAFIAGCAPRMNKTHFARWEEQDQRRREENANDEKVEAWLRQQAGVPSTSDAKNQPPGSAPRTGNTTQSTTSQTTSTETPAIRHTETATKSRVIRPSETTTEEEEAVY